jgi:hypothetical protein
MSLSKPIIITYYFFLNVGVILINVGAILQWGDFAVGRFDQLPHDSFLRLFVWMLEI